MRKDGPTRGPANERLADAAVVCRRRSGRRRMSEVSRRRRSSRSRFDTARQKGPLSNLSGNSFSLPVSFPDACCLSVTGESGSKGCPGRICRSSQVVGCNVGQRHGLPGRKSGELRRVGQSRCGSIRHESGPVRITHANLAPDPGTTDVDSVTRAGVARLRLLEKVQDVFGAEGGPLRKQPVVLVCNVPPRRMVISRGSRSLAGSA